MEMTTPKKRVKCADTLFSHFLGEKKMDLGQFIEVPSHGVSAN